MGSFYYFSYTIQIGSNWYMDTGVHDLEVACFKANATCINNKDLSNRPIYAVLNTRNLDMILQLKYITILLFHEPNVTISQLSVSANQL